VEISNGVPVAADQAFRLRSWPTANSAVSSSCGQYTSE